MMKRTIILLMLIVHFLFADWFSFDNMTLIPTEPDISFINTTDSSVTVQIDLFGIDTSSFYVEGTSYKVISLPNCHSYMNYGAPDIPLINRLIPVPEFENYEIVMLDSELVIIDSLLIKPYIKYLDSGMLSEFYIDSAIYNDIIAYPSKPVYLDSSMILRDIRVSSMNISPVFYDPVSNKINAYKKLIFKIKYKNVSNYNQFVRANDISKVWNGIYESCVMNYSNIVNYNNPTQSTTTNYDYLIITSDEYYEKIKIFANWKTQRGMKTEILSMTELQNLYSGLDDDDAIYECICDEVSTHNIQYVLLVGSLTDIPSYSNDGDYLYSVIDNKKNLFPSCAIGRFPVHDANELINIINKSIVYERSCLQVDWSRNSLLINGDYVNDMHKNVLISVSEYNYNRNVNFSFLDVPFKNSIISEINNGCNSVLYLGHGLTTKWLNYSEYNTQSIGNFSYESIQSLENNSKLPVVFSLTCNTGSTGMENSFCNEFINNANGSVAFYGAKSPTYNVRNNIMAEWIPKLLFDSNDIPNYGIGDITNYAGINSIIKGRYGSNFNWIYKDNIKHYRWLGDPSLKMWTDIKKNSGTSLTVSKNTIGVSTLDDCSVCISSFDNGETYFQSNKFDNTFSFDISGVTVPLYITVSKRDYLPEQYVTGGLFTENQYFYGNIILEGDLVIDTNDTLFINERTSLNLNGYNIINNGGIIIIEDGAEIVPDVRLVNGSTIEGLYSTTASAFDDGSVVEIRNEYVSSVDISIVSGKTLKPQSGSELNFTSGKYLKIENGGNLTANGATFTSTSGTWGGIKYNSGSSGSLSNCTISNATCGVYLNAGRSITNCTISTDGSYNYGVYINSASPTILNCNITGSNFSSTSNVSYGIYSYGGAPCIINNTIGATYGIYNYNSSPEIKDNDITSELVGLYCENSSPYLVEYADHGHNDFHGSYSECGVWATNGSHPVLGTQDCGWGENKFVYNDVEALAYAETGSSIYAKYNWWGSSDPSSSLFNGDVTYLPCLTSPPVFSPQAPSPENNLYDTRMMLAGAIPDSVEEGSEDFLRYYNDQWDLEKKMGFLRYLYMLGEAEGLADLCKDIIEENPYEPEAFTALDLIYQISKNEKIKKGFDKEMLKTYLKTFEESRSNQLLKANAMLMLAGIENDVARMDEVYAANKNAYIGKHALRKKFMYYFYEEADLKLARAVLNEMDEVYPNEAVTYESHVLMGDKVIDPAEFYSRIHKMDTPQELQSTPTDIADAIPEEYALNAAYPNPFNPSTTLEYALPVHSEVKCSIYDVRGNLVKEYSFNQNAGTYSIVWDALNVSSGIYLIRFTAESKDGSESFVDYQKVTLLK